MDRPEWALRLPPLLVRDRTSYGTADMLEGGLVVLELETPDMADKLPLLPTCFIVIVVVVVVVVIVTGVELV